MAVVFNALIEGSISAGITEKFPKLIFKPVAILKGGYRQNRMI